MKFMNRSLGVSGLDLDTTPTSLKGAVNTHILSGRRDIWRTASMGLKMCRDPKLPGMS